LKTIHITGTGSFLPERVLHNRDLEQSVDTTDAWIFERTGIRERRIAAEGQGACDLAEPAARAALAMAGIEASSLDLIVLATSTPDMFFPSTACLLQARLGAEGCAAFDLQAACTGFVYAMSVAEQFLRNGSARRALVVGSEVLSRIVDWSDRGTCILFGDGAGAVVLEAREGGEEGLLGTHIHADGRHADLLKVPVTWPRPLNGHASAGHFIEMAGSEVFKVAVQTLGALVDESVQRAGLVQGDIDWLVPHQANQRIIQAVAKRLGLPLEQVVLTVERHGNTSAASIPLALDEAVRDGRIKPGQLLLLEAFGGGFTWGSALVRWQPLACDS
jgi:3-oxoacyl-[acyl-carrier-protein] synthase III